MKNLKKKKCLICSKDILLFEITYLNPNLLKKFLNNRMCLRKKDKIFLCSKHNRYFRKQVKIARNLHLLPYIKI